MSWLFPGYALAGVIAAAAVVGLHLIMHRLPPLARFPTARFIPPGTARAIRRALRPDDLLLLALRVATLLLLGAALARPVITPDRRPVATVVAMDRSRAVASIDEARERAASLLDDGDVLIVFDSSARELPVSDSIATIERSDAQGSLSAALLAAMQAAARIREDADSIEIVLVTPAVREELDAATDAIRAVWPGRFRLVRVAADSSPAPANARGVANATTAPPDDAVAVAAALWGWGEATRNVRLVRRGMSVEDSAWAREGGVLIHWPVTSASAPSIDSSGAVMAAGAVIVAPFARHGVPAHGANVASGQPVAGWVDGRAAAVERQSGTGCIREVAIEVPRRGDLVLRPSFGRFLHALGAPCGGAMDLRPMPAEAMERLTRDGPLALAAALPGSTSESTLAPWLLIAAIALALLEPLARRRRVEE